MLIRLSLSVITAAILSMATGCQSDNPYYCEDRAYHNCGNEPGTYPCDSKEDCSGQEGKLACTEPNPSTGFGVCVQCTSADATACSAAAPVCGTDNTCRTCSKHSECASAACLPDGSCGSDANVAYVAANGSGSTCTKAAPCGTPAAAVALGKPFIKVATGLVKSSLTTVIDAKTVTILADDGAKLDRDTEDGPVIRIQGRADVNIYDLEITGASGSGANGIDLDASGAPKLALTRVKLTSNQGLGLLAQGGTVTISQSVVSGNTGGGLSLSNATFDITNNFIYRNGNSDGGGDFGGANLSVASATGNRFQFNTVVDNHARAGGTTAGGLRCDVPGLAPANNIIARNDIARDVNAANANTLAAGACTYPSSILEATVTSLRFVESEQAPFNYRLASGSSAIDKADTASEVAIDVDGEARPQGAQKDIGADEYKAN